MKKHLFIPILFSIVLNANAQSSCSMINSEVGDPKALVPSCGAYHDYSVYPNYTQTPIKYVRISFDIFQRADGTGSFNASDATLQNYFQAMVDSANYRLANLQLINPAATSPHVVDSRIRLQLDTSFIYKNDNLFNYSLTANVSTTTRVRIVSDSIYNNVIQANSNLSYIDKFNTLHLLMFPKGIYPLGGMAANLSDRRWIYLRGYDYNFNYANGGPGNGFGPSIQETVGHLIHEVCHSFGLYHNFQGGTFGSQCTIDRDFIADAGCPLQGTSNNYMDYQAHYLKNALSEDQIAKMHYCLTGNVGDIVSDVVQDYCEYNASQSTTIASGQNIVWGGSKNLLGNLFINGSLTVKCNVSLPFGGKVIVNSGGKLIISGSGAHFMNACGDSLTAIEVLSGGYLEMYAPPGFLSMASVRDCNVKVKSGGTIRIISPFLIQGNHSVTVESGGFICIEPTANILLQHFNSVINLKCGYLSGINPSVTGITSNCVASPGTFVTSGLGKINAASFLADVYIQNTTLNGNQYITGNNIYIGSNVTTGTQGPVYIGNGANIILNACGDLIVPLDFDNPSTNSTLEIAAPQ